MHGECVQRVFPPYYFSGDIGTVFERILDHEIEYFERGLLVREMTATSSGLPESGIQAFDRVRRVHQPTQLRRVGQKRRDCSQFVRQSRIIAGYLSSHSAQKLVRFSQ